jgi:hypothetical protein
MRVGPVPTATYRNPKCHTWAESGKQPNDIFLDKIMPTGKLNLQLSNLSGTPLNDKVEIDFRPFSNDLGVGGEPMEVALNMGRETDAIISGLLCKGGLGTMYRVSASTPHYRDYSFFQTIVENTVNMASDDVEFWIKPGDVKNVVAPAFSALSAKAQEILTVARMTVEKPEDRDLLGLSGQSLYDALGPLRKACFLNIVKKASHPTAADCLPEIAGLLICRQDRLFAFVNAGLEERVNASPNYRSADSSLHHPLAGFTLKRSFKSRDAHANLQLTFMVENATGRMAADIDIDESSGIEHGKEVIKNALFRSRTNPYLIREFMLSADPVTRSLDPGYTFIFK